MRENDCNRDCRSSLPLHVDQDIKNQKLQEKKKENLAKAARPAAVAAQVKPNCAAAIKHATSTLTLARLCCRKRRRKRKPRGENASRFMRVWGNVFVCRRSDEEARRAREQALKVGR